MAKPLEHPCSRLIQNKQTSIGIHPVGTDSEASHSLTLLKPVDQDAVQLTSYSAESRKNSMLGAQYENALFSSSMSELFTQKKILSSNNVSYGNSAEIVAFSHEGEELVQSSEEIGAQTIRDILPEDDELLSAMVDIDYSAQHINADDTQELDFFNSVGGMDLADDGSSSSAVGSLHRFDFGSANGSCPVPGNYVTWGNSYHSQPPEIRWQKSPSASSIRNFCSQPPQSLNKIERAQSRMLNPALPINNHVGSAPTVSPFWNRRQTYMGESSDASGVHPTSLGCIRMSKNSLHSVDFVSHNIFSPAGGSCMDSRHKSLPLQAHQQMSRIFPGRNQMPPMIKSFVPSSGRDRSRRNESCFNRADKRQFDLDIGRIMRGEDRRTTLMIKNIPNKYTKMMLLAAIDKHHKGTYDFIYLPIDFKNKCNVGYAFINMTEPKHIIPFYQTFNGKKWEIFNSEKVASLAYARIQSKKALIAHFQNSSLMTEDEHFRPILFDTEGPNAGNPVPFPSGANIKNQPSKSPANTNACHQESPPISAYEDNSSNVKGESSSAPAKHLD